MRSPVLYFTLGSPDSYLAIESAERALGCTPRLEPVLLDGVFHYRGWGSWAAMRGRARWMAEVEGRAHSLGLAPVVWPAVWPGAAPAAMRAAWWANTYGYAFDFVQTLFRRQFGHGADLADLGLVMECALEAGLEPGPMMAAIGRLEAGRALRAATQRGWDAGVRGVPAVRVGDTVFSGVGGLELAADLLNS